MFQNDDFTNEPSVAPVPLTRRAAGSATLAAAVMAALGTIALPAPARADDAELQALKQQVQDLTRKIEALAAKQAATPAAAPAPSATESKPASTTPSFNAGPVSVTLGGFVELMAIGRSHNQAADWASNWNTAIPFPQNQNYGLSEFRLTERQSRVSALVTGPADSNVAVESYLETDFGGGPRTGNNNESSSFSPRVRHLYADYQRKDAGWYLLFGQTWSLATQNKVGITLRQEQIPLTIDGQYVPGFTWSRVPQIRFVKNFGSTVALGLSVENPAAIGLSTKTTCAAAPGTTSGPYCYTPGGSGYDANNNITLDPAPDVIAKVAVDPGFGHYEVYGLFRQFRDRYAGGNNTTSSSAVGGSVILPLIKNQLEFSASFLAGDGIGRYGSAQLPDATTKPDGTLAAIKGYDVLAGLTWKPIPTVSLYVYGGREHDDRTDFSAVVAGKTVAYGYGNPLYDNSGCLIEGSALKCDANTSSITQATIGGWWKFYQGVIGNMQLGLQLTHVKREVYSGVGGDPSTGINVGELSFRFYPFQK